MSVYQGSNLVAGGSSLPSLFDFKWADHQLNDISWLRADTFSWQSGSVYSAAYQHLVAEHKSKQIVVNNFVYDRAPVHDIAGQYGWYSEEKQPGDRVVYTLAENPTLGAVVYNVGGGVEGSVEKTNFGIDIIGNISVEYILADDGHKICPANQESNVASIFSATGVAWYYILDTANQRFKLPRSSHNKYTKELSVIGTGTTLGLTNNGTNMYALGGLGTAGLGGYFQTFQNNTTPGSTSGAATRDTGALGVLADPTKSGLKTTFVEKDTDQYKYLYFYVGQFSQPAIEQTAGLNASLFNGKADLSLMNTASNIDFVIESQEPTAGNNYTWYRLYRSGWVEQGGRTATNISQATITLPVEMADTEYSVIATTRSNNIGTGGFDRAPGSGALTTTSFKLEMAANTNYFSIWEVKGFASA